MPSTIPSELQGVSVKDLVKALGMYNSVYDTATVTICVRIAKVVKEGDAQYYTIRAAGCIGQGPCQGSR